MSKQIKYPFPLDATEIVSFELPCRILTQGEVKRLSTFLAALGGIATAQVIVVYRDEKGRFAPEPIHAD